MAIGTPFKTFAPHPGAGGVYSASFDSGLMGTVDRYADGLPDNVFKVSFTAEELPEILNKIWNAKEYSSNFNLFIDPDIEFGGGYATSLSGRFLSTYASTSGVISTEYARISVKPTNPIDAIDGTTRVAEYDLGFFPAPSFSTEKALSTLPRCTLDLPLRFTGGSGLDRDYQIQDEDGNVVGNAALTSSAGADVTFDARVVYVRLLPDGGVDLYAYIRVYFADASLTTETRNAPSLIDDSYQSREFTGTLYGKPFSFWLWSTLGYDIDTLTASINIDMAVSEFYTYP